LSIVLGKFFKQTESISRNCTLLYLISIRILFMKGGDK